MLTDNFCVNRITLKPCAAVLQRGVFGLQVLACVLVFHLVPAAAMFSKNPGIGLNLLHTVCKK